MQSIWNALLAESAADTLFLRWEWMASWWEAYGDDREFSLLAVYEGDCLVGLAPFTVSATGLPGVKAVRLFGAEDLWPDYLDIIAIRGSEQAVVSAAFDYMTDCRGGWSVMDFDHLLPESSLLTWGVSGGRRLDADVRPRSKCPYLPIAGTFDGYMQTHFNKKKRYNLLRQLRIALVENGLQVERVQEPGADWDRLLAEFFELHEKRKRAQGMSSSITDSRARDFYARFTRRAAASGFLDLRFLRRGQQALAVGYSLRYAHKVFFLQSGFDPSAESLSVGTVLLTETLRSAFDEGMREFDFLKGEEAYKDTWATANRTELRAHAFRDDIGGRLARASEQAKTRVKAWLRP